MVRQLFYKGAPWGAGFERVTEPALLSVYLLIRRTDRSLTFVPVGPVMIRPLTF